MEHHRVSSAELDRRCTALAETKRLLARSQQSSMAFSQSGPPVNSPTMTLEDLTDRFATVATSSVSGGDGPTVWTYLLDKLALNRAREQGIVVTGQMRTGDGLFELRAKLTGRGAA